MNNQRFSEFRSDLVKLFETIYTEYPDSTDFVKNLGKELGTKYPELVNVNQDEPQTRQDEPQTRQEDIYKKVSKEMELSIKLDRLMDYRGIEGDLKRSSPEECIILKV
ncbi:hypothetical protein OS493_007181 [Desmophyllum pertusum]|uniref:Uncharacterized protein n=1 Tax=Desmophyllum pertusum TaxID=174260 RepID=A0A9W9ZIV3_9CNID|nr:hypothetical protein OS493_007181 [Desmophyllum pertusum]